MSSDEQQVLDYTSGKSRQEAIALWSERRKVTLDTLATLTKVRAEAAAKPPNSQPTRGEQTVLANEAKDALWDAEVALTALTALNRPPLETDPGLEEVARTLAAIERDHTAGGGFTPSATSEYLGLVSIAAWWSLADAGAPRAPASVVEQDDWFAGSVLRLDTPGSVWYLSCWAASDLPEDSIWGPIQPGVPWPTATWFCLPLAFPETMRVIYEDFRVKLGRENAIIALTESLSVGGLPRDRLQLGSEPRRFSPAKTSTTDAGLVTP